MRLTAASAEVRIEGLPRPGRRHFGVPPGGAFDQFSLALANAMLGNGASAAALELPAGRFGFEVDRAVEIALVGASARLLVNDARQESARRCGLGPGDRLVVDVLHLGTHALLGVGGGATGEPGTSLAVGEAFGAGGYRVGAGLAAGQRLEVETPDRWAGPLRVIPGADADLMMWEEAPLEVTPVGDRRGLRLRGPKPPPFEERLSAPVALGLVQVTSGGDWLILGPDGPTIGGYPQIATIVTADLPRLAHLRPGEKVRLLAVSLDQARALEQDRERALAGVRLMGGVA